MADLFDQFNIEPEKPAGDLFDQFGVVPSDPETEQRQTILDEESGRIIDSPIGIEADNAVFHDRVDNRDEDHGKFMGYVDIGVDHAAAVGNGLLRLPASAPSLIAGGTAIQQAELNIQALRGDQPTSINDIVDLARQDELSLKQLVRFVADENTPGVVKLFSARGRAEAGARFNRFFLDQDQIDRKIAEQDRIIVASRRMMESNQRWLDKHIPRPEGSEGVAFDVGNVFGSVFTSVAAAYMTKSAVVPAMLFGKIQQSSAYIEARDRGFDVNDAGTISNVMGAVEAGLEFIGVNTFMKLGGKAKGAGLILFRGIEEAFQEGSQTASEEIIAQVSNLRDVDVTGGIGRVAYSMILGFIGGGGTASAIEIGKSVSKQEGMELSDQEVTALSTALEKNKDAFEDEIVKAMENEASKSAENPAISKQVANIINKFQQGEVIDVQKEIAESSQITDQEKKDLLTAVQEAETQTLQAVEREVATGRISQLEASVSAIDGQLSAAQESLDVAEAELLGFQENKPPTIPGTVEAQQVKDQEKQLKDVVSEANKAVNQLSKSRTKADEELGLLLEEGVDEVQLQRGQGVPDSPQNIIQFLVERGGVNAGSELAGRDLEKATGEGSRTLRSLVDVGGLTLDEAREAAEEAGFLIPDTIDETTTINDLINAIDETISGAGVFSQEDAGDLAGVEQAQATNEQINELNERMIQVRDEIVNTDLPSDRRITADDVRAIAEESLRRDAEGGVADDVDDGAITAFHQTNETFDEFDFDQTADGTIWFSSDSAELLREGSAAAASTGNKRVVTAQIQLKKPATSEDIDRFSVGELRRDGFDGVVYEDGDIQVFEESAIVGINNQERKAFEEAQQQATQPASSSVTEIIEELEGILPTLDNPAAVPVRRILESSGGARTAFEAPKVAGSKTVSLRAADLRKLGVKITKQSVRGVQQGLRAGQKLARSDAKAAQEVLINTIEKSGLTPKDQKKFTKTIKNITGTLADPKTKDLGRAEGSTAFDQLEKQLPSITARINKLLEKEQRRQLESAAKKILKTTKTTKQSGREISKFKDADFEGNPDFETSAEFQAEMDSLREITELKLEDGEKVSVERAHELLNDQASTLSGNEKALLATVLRSDLITPAQSADMLIDLSKMVSTTRASGKFGQIKKKLKNKEVAEDVADQLITAAEIKALDINALNNVIQTAAKGTRTFFDFSVRSWDGLRNAAFSHKDVSAKEIIARTNIFKEEQDAKRLRLDTSSAYRDQAMEALGTTRESVYVDKVIDDHKEINIGKEKLKQGERDDHEYTDSNGDNTNFKMSKAQIRYMLMQMETAEIKQEYFDPKKNAFTQEMVDDATSFLDASDFMIMEARFEAVDDLYNPHNRVYSKLNGVNLRRSDRYFPLERENSDENEYSWQEDQRARASISLGSQKKRVKNRKKIKLVSDEVVMQRHILEVSHYVATAEKLGQIRQIFGNQRLRNSIESRVGKKTMKMIDNQIDDFIRSRVKEGSELDALINKMNANFASSVLLLKPAIGVKQLTSIPAFLEFLPAQHFAKGMADYIKNPAKANRILRESSAFLEDRGANPEKSIANVARQDTSVKKQMRVPFTEWTVEQFMGISIKLGDVGAINAGGWAVYKYNLEVLNKSHAESILAFEEAAAKRQQTKDLSQLSSLQRSHSLGRSMTQFSSSPLSYLRAEIDAVESLIRRGKKGSAVEGSTLLTPQEIGRNLALYHLLIPALWQFVVDGFDYELDHQIRAMILGSFNAVALLGQVGGNILAGLMDDDEYDIDAVNFPEALEQMGRGIVSVIENGTDINSDEFYGGVKNLASSIGRLTGKPVKQVFDVFEGQEDFSDGDLREGTLIMLGWPAAAVEE